MKKAAATSDENSITYLSGVLKVSKISHRKKVANPTHVSALNTGLRRAQLLFMVSV
jgi:hypothetical protein